ncbi:AAA family ATPase [Sinorhizobium americanum]|uniref:AAA domain-containing protein n=1 Tax=Sinorhizobium americanum TaxID=194963 RepID=A0A4R2BMY6_9HYPH|nr:AAA domain-containing protein [Sinorhizobium americanum]
MYAKSLTIYDFKCFQRAKLDLQYPGRKTAGSSEISNVNLILGDNGGGKSSVLRALAIAVLAPALQRSGFVPYRLVRRQVPGMPEVSHCLLKVIGKADSHEGALGLKSRIELLARLDPPARGNLDRIYLEYTPDSPVTPLLEDDFSPAFFVVGYGATRRVETGDYSESSARRSRGLRYQRIAGLFEDHVALRPLTTWLSRLKPGSPRFAEAVSLLNEVLPNDIAFTGAFLPEDEQYLFDFEGAPTPFNSLSDGYKAFIGWIGDLIGHLADVASQDEPLNSINGIVLVDEIDLHLHPSWQRQVVQLLSKTFPRLQFVFTSHSPLVATSVKRENIFITDRAENGTATISQIAEHAFGQSVEQMLLSSYFGLTTTRPESFEQESQSLFKRVADGDSGAALEFLKRVTSPSRSAG